LTVLSFESLKNFLVFQLLKISQHFCVPVNNNRLGATENLSVIVAADKCAPEASLISTTEKKEIKNKKNWKMEKKNWKSRLSEPNDITTNTACLKRNIKMSFENQTL
jgi:hypothetical protein